MDQVMSFLSDSITALFTVFIIISGMVSWLAKKVFKKTPRRISKKPAIREMAQKQFNLVYHPIEKLLLDKKYKASLNYDSYLRVRALLVDMNAIFVQNLKLADPKLVEDCDDLRTRCPKKSNECDAKLDKELNVFIARVQWECTALRKSLGYPTGILPWTERGDAFVCKMICGWVAISCYLLILLRVALILIPALWKLVSDLQTEASSLVHQLLVLTFLAASFMILTGIAASKERERNDTRFLKRKDRKKKRSLKVQIGKWVTFPFDLLIRFRLVIGVVIAIAFFMGIGIGIVIGLNLAR